jgi:hypothetical protein
MTGRNGLSGSSPARRACTVSSRNRNVAAGADLTRRIGAAIDHSESEPGFRQQQLDIYGLVS